MFNSNVSFQDAVSMAVEQIGENAKRLSDEFINKHKEIPWHLVRGMRNILTHEYENIDFDEVWDTVINDIPALRGFCEGVLKNCDK